MNRNAWKLGTETLTPLAALRRFFYSEEVSYGMALMRIFLPLVLLGDAGYRWAYARELYSSDGAPAPLAMEFGCPNFLPILPAWLAVPLHTALLCFLVMSSIGWFSRFSLCAATTLYFYFGMLDSLSTMTKYSVIACHAMLMLCLSQAGTVWSVDAWFKGTWRRAPGPAVPPVNWPVAAVWPQRLVQIMVGMVYLGAAMTKLHTPVYFSGDQLLYWMMTKVTAAHPVGEYLSQFPAIAICSAYVCVVWEVAFIFCSWRGWTRIVMIATGVVFHLGTTLMLGLTLFPLVMFAIYLSFLQEADVQWLGHHYRRLRRKCLGTLRPVELAAQKLGLAVPPQPRFSKATAAAIFGGLVALVALAGSQIERSRDYYGERRPGGPSALRELTAAEVDEMLAPEATLREEDKFLTFDIGTLLIGERLCNRVSELRQNEPFYCEANLCPPHEDMWVECNLHDSEDRIVSRVGQVVTREMFRGHFTYSLNERFEPGEYSMVLRSRGKEVMRRKFTLLPGIPSPLAN